MLDSVKIVKIASKKLIMNENSLDRSPTENLLDLHLDKDTWIYTYGSAQLQQVRSFGYDCDKRYLQERLKAEYPGFIINTGSGANKLDFPPMYAIRESLKWTDAYIAKQYTHGEVIAILQGRGSANDNYLGYYQIVKQTTKPWYLLYKNINPNHPLVYCILAAVWMGVIFCVAIWL
jgi:hypothetical protein